MPTFQLHILMLCRNITLNKGYSLSLEINENVLHAFRVCMCGCVDFFIFLILFRHKNPCLFSNIVIAIHGSEKLLLRSSNSINYACDKDFLLH